MFTLVSTFSTMISRTKKHHITSNVVSWMHEIHSHILLENIQMVIAKLKTTNYYDVVGSNINAYNMLINHESYFSET